MVCILLGLFIYLNQQIFDKYVKISIPVKIIQTCIVVTSIILGAFGFVCIVLLTIFHIYLVYIGKTTKEKL